MIMPIIKEIKTESERILSVDATLGGYEAKLICSYAPTADDDDLKIDEFYNILKELLQHMPKTKNAWFLEILRRIRSFLNNTAVYQIDTTFYWKKGLTATSRSS